MLPIKEVLKFKKRYKFEITTNQINTPMLNNNTIAIYVILDDILQQIAHKEDEQRKVNDAMILTTVLISAWYPTALSVLTRNRHCFEHLAQSKLRESLRLKYKIKF